MNRVLILCESPLAERELEDTLKRLNMEVYCSTSLRKEVISQRHVIRYFNLVIVSDTVVNINFFSILKELRTFDIPIIRKGSKNMIDVQESSWIEKEVDRWIDTNAEEEQIIEIVSQVLSSQSSKNVPIDNTDISWGHYTDFISTFSKNERDFLYLLYQAEENTLTRNELCYGIWKSEPTVSNLSQLSSIASRVKKKMLGMGYKGTGIQTTWGKGYHLEESIVTFLKEHDFVENK